MRENYIKMSTIEKANVEVATGCETTQETILRSELDANALIQEFDDYFNPTDGEYDGADNYKNPEEIRIMVNVPMDVWLKKNEWGKWYVESAEPVSYVEDDVEEFLNEEADV